MKWEPLSIKGNSLAPFEINEAGQIRNAGKRLIPSRSIEEALEKWNHASQMTRAGNPPVTANDIVVLIKDLVGVSGDSFKTLWMCEFKHTNNQRSYPELYLPLDGDRDVGWHVLINTKRFVSIVHGGSLANQIFSTD
jgi:hypothetical protein